MANEFEPLIQYMMGTGATRTEAQMIVDLGHHAALEALDKVKALTDNAPTPLISTASYVVALRMLHTNIGHVLEARSAKG